MQIYVNKGGRQYGPYTVEQLLEYIQQGSFSPHDLACFDGQNWVKVTDVPGLTLGSQQPMPPPAPLSSAPKKIVLWSSIGGITALLAISLAVWFLAISGEDLDYPGTFDKIITAAIRSDDIQRREKDGENLTARVEELDRISVAKKKRLRSAITSINSRLSTNEILTDTVFQQQAARIYACIELAEVIALSLGADDSSTSSITSALSTNEILADTVYQQIAARLSAQANMIGLAAEAAGASSRSVSSAKSNMSTNDILADTVQQQIAARIEANLQMAQLLANALGVSSASSSSVISATSSNDILSDTVFQQMAARQGGLTEMLELIALKTGAPPSRVTRANSKMSSADILADTVQQQLAGRIQGSANMLTLIAEALLE